MAYFTNKDLAVIKNYAASLNEAIRKNDLNAFFKALSVFFASIPYSVHVKQEKYYQSLFYAILDLIGATVQVEEETNDGRIDAIIKTETHIYIFEFKMDAPAAKALAQIEDKRYYQKYLLTKKKIALIAVGFNSEKRTIEEWLLKEIA